MKINNLIFILFVDIIFVLIFLLILVFYTDQWFASSKGDDGEYLNLSLLPNYYKFMPHVLPTLLGNIFNLNIEYSRTIAFFLNLMSLNLLIYLIFKTINIPLSRTLHGYFLVLCWIFSNPALVFSTIYVMRDIYIVTFLYLFFVSSKNFLSSAALISFLYLRPTAIIVAAAMKFKHIKIWHLLAGLICLGLVPSILKFLLMPAGVLLGHTDFSVFDLLLYRWDKLFESGISNSGNIFFDLIIITFKTLTRPIFFYELPSTHFGRNGYDGVEMLYSSVDVSLLFANLSVLPNLIVSATLVRSMLKPSVWKTRRSYIFFYVLLSGIYGVFTFSERQLLMFSWFELIIIFGLRNDYHN